MDRDEATLLDIVRAAQLTQQFVTGMTKDEFLADPKTQSAILHQLNHIGRSCKAVIKNFSCAECCLPWSLMSGMRDRLIHGYDVVDLDEVWNTIIKDIPNVLTNIAPLLPQSPEQ